MRFVLVLSLSLASIAVVPAQNRTSPAGLGATEGSTSFSHWTQSSTGTGRRFQQIDNTHAGSQFLVRSLGWRRNGTGSGGGTNAPARTFDLEVRMDQVSMGVLSNDLLQNQVNPTVVHARSTVNMPDWTGLNGTPSPFDFVVPLGTPYVYLGNDALLIYFDYVNNTASTGAATDRDYRGSRNGNGAALGTGCTVTGGSGAFTHLMRLENNGPALANYGMRLRVNGARALPGANVFMHVDGIDANQMIPGLCSLLHALPLVTLGLGPADAVGVVPQTSLSFPYSGSLVGAQLVTQFLQLDPGQSGLPIVVSNGRRATMPAATSPSTHECLYQWATTPNTTGTLFWGGGIVMQLGL